MFIRKLAFNVSEMLTGESFHAYSITIVLVMGFTLQANELPFL